MRKIMKLILVQKYIISDREYVLTKFMQKSWISGNTGKGALPYLSVGVSKFV